MQHRSLPPLFFLSSRRTWISAHTRIPIQVHLLGRSHDRLRKIPLSIERPNSRNPTAGSWPVFGSDELPHVDVAV